MYALFRFSGLFSVPLSDFLSLRPRSSKLILDDQSVDFRFSHMNESYFSAVGDDDLTPRAAEVSAPLSAYRRWLSAVFGVPGTSTPADASFVSRPDGDGWVVVEKIKREDRVFEDMWDPSVSGDWSDVLGRHGHASAPSVASPGRALEMPASALLRWAFKTEAEDETDREFDRIAIWRKSALSLMHPDKDSYLEAVMKEISESVADAIDRDIHRTNPPELHSRMRRVLQAYAARNPSVGFCQGMSYIVSALLQTGWASDEDAFIILSALVESVNAGYYDSDLSGLHMDLKRLHKFSFYILKSVPPVAIELVLVEPMICLFSRSGSFESSTRILDIALTHGKVGLFAVYLALLELVHDSVATSMRRADSPSSAVVEGAVAFKSATIGVLTENLHLLLNRAEAFLLTHRVAIERVCKETILDEDGELVLQDPRRPLSPPDEDEDADELSLFALLRSTLVSMLDRRL